MQEQELKIIVRLINESKAGITAIEKGFDSISKKAKNIGQSTQGANVGTANFIKTILGAKIIIDSFNFAMRLGKQALDLFATTAKNAIDDVVKFEASMTGLVSIASKFGISSDKAKDAAISLSQDGLISVTEASEGLKNLLATGFGLEESIRLMDGLKDSAAFNRQGQLELGQAIVGATSGLKNQNSVMVDNAGVTKNLSVILKEQGLSQQDLGRVTSDANVRQALYNGILKETALFSGDAAKLSESFGGQLAQLNTATQTLSTAFGFVLKPSVESIITPIAELGKEFSQFFSENQETLEAFGQNLSVLFGIALGDVQGAIDGITPENIVIAMGEIVKGINVVIASARVLKNVLDFAFSVGPLNLLRTGLKGIQIELQRIVDLFTNIDLSNLQETQRRFTQINQKAAADSKALFSESYLQPLQNVQNAYGDLQEILDFDVKEAFQRAAKSSKKSADVMGKSWMDNLNNIEGLSKDILRKIEKENEKFIDQIEKRTKAFQERLDDLIISHREKIAALKDDLAEEKKELQKAVNERRHQADKEIDVINELANDKTRILQEEIQREKAANLQNEQANISSLEQQIRDIESSKDEEIKVIEQELDEEIRLIKSKRQERINEIQVSLNKELQLQKKFAGDFKRLKNKVAEDDITRLKRKFAEETVLMERQHQKRLVDLAEQGRTEGQAFNRGLGGGTSGLARTISDEFKLAMESIRKSIQAAALSIFEGRQGGAQSFKGGAVRVNEAGGEIINLPSGSQIIPAERTKEIVNNNSSNSTSSVNVSIKANRFMGSKTEARRMAMEIVEAIRNLATNRGVTTTDFLNLNQ